MRNYNIEKNDVVTVQNNNQLLSGKVKSVEGDNLKLAINSSRFVTCNVNRVCSVKPRIVASTELLSDMVVFENKKLLETFGCSICLQICENPAQTSCGHLFCFSCVIQVEKSCPLCRSSDIMVKSDLFAQRMIENLEVRCPSCVKWTGKWQSLKQHWNQCEKQLFKCTGCTKIMTYVQVYHHVNFDCPDRYVKCPCCQIELSHSMLTHHINSGCHTNIPCLCPFHDYGCQIFTTDIQSHLIKEKSAHLKLLHVFNVSQNEEPVLEFVDASWRFNLKIGLVTGISCAAIIISLFAVYLI